MTFKNGLMSGGLFVLFVLMLASCDSKPEDPTIIDTGTDTGGQDTGGQDVPIADPQTLVNKTYIFEIGEGNWSTPRGSGKEFGIYVPTLMFQLTQIGADNTMTLFAGTAKNGAQDPCTVTMNLPGTFNGNPYFETTPVDFASYAENPAGKLATKADATLYNMTLKGRFVDGGARIDNGELWAIIDFRELYEIFNAWENPTAELICEKVPDYKVTCTPCPKDNQPYCLQLGAELIKVNEAVGQPMTQVTQACTIK